MSTSDRVAPESAMGTTSLRAPRSPTQKVLTSALDNFCMSKENTPVRALAMDARPKFPTSPGTPLFPLSPERVNGARPPYGAMPQSPSMPEFIKPSEFELYPTSPKKTAHSRNNSEALVQGMVARFDSLSLKDHQQMHRRDEVAIKRAEMAREMAEMELKKAQEEREERENEAKKWREECRKMKREVEDGRERERKMAKRLEAQTDDIERTARTTEHQRAVMDKDARRLRKEAYKTESALVKLQEELKTARASLKVAHSATESEKAKALQREQEAFAAEYKLVGVQEELLKAQERLKVIEEERDALKRNLKEEEVARIAAEGRIALPESADGDDDFASPVRPPRKKLPSPDAEDKENVAPPPRVVEIRALKDELRIQSQLRSRAEDQIEFMKMECQFRCCSCRMAEQRGGRYIHDNSFEIEMHSIREGLSRELSPPLTDDETDAKLDTVMDQEMGDNVANDLQDDTISVVDCEPAVLPEVDIVAEAPEKQNQVPQHEMDETFPPNSKLTQAIDLDEAESHSFPAHDRYGPTAHARTVPSPVLPISPPTGASAQDDRTATTSETPWIPHTPRFREVRTITTTTTIPLAFTPSSTPRQAEERTGPLTPATIGHLPTQNIAASSQPFPASPGTALRPDGTLDREAALEQIRLRRGRARSMAMGLGTPKKQMVEGMGRRDISAPAIKGR